MPIALRLARLSVLSCRIQHGIQTLEAGTSAVPGFWVYSTGVQGLFVHTVSGLCHQERSGLEAVADELNVERLWVETMPLLPYSDRETI